ADGGERPADEAPAAKEIEVRDRDGRHHEERRRTDRGPRTELAQERHRQDERVGGELEKTADAERGEPARERDALPPEKVGRDRDTRDEAGRDRPSGRERGDRQPEEEPGRHAVSVAPEDRVPGERRERGHAERR